MEESDLKFLYATRKTEFRNPHEEKRTVTLFGFLPYGVDEESGRKVYAPSLPKVQPLREIRIESDDGQKPSALSLVYECDGREEGGAHHTIRRLMEALDRASVTYDLIMAPGEPYARVVTGKQITGGESSYDYAVRLKHGDPGVEEFLKSRKALEFMPEEAVELFQKPAAEIYMRSYEQAERARGRLGTT